MPAGPRGAPLSPGGRSRGSGQAQGFLLCWGNERQLLGLPTASHLLSTEGSTETWVRGPCGMKDHCDRQCYLQRMATDYVSTMYSCPLSSSPKQHREAPTYNLYSSHLKEALGKVKWVGVVLPFRDWDPPPWLPSQKTGRTWEILIVPHLHFPDDAEAV